MYVYNYITSKLVYIYIISKHRSVDFDATHSCTLFSNNWSDTATHCNNWSDTATHCNTRRHTVAFFSHSDHHTATRCNTLLHTFPTTSMAQGIATHCNTLQHTAIRCNMLQHTADSFPTVTIALQYTATHCDTLRHTATLCCALFPHSNHYCFFFLAIDFVPINICIYVYAYTYFYM